MNLYRVLLFTYRNLHSQHLHRALSFLFLIMDSIS